MQPAPAGPTAQGATPSASTDSPQKVQHEAYMRVFTREFQKRQDKRTVLAHTHTQHNPIQSILRFQSSQSQLPPTHSFLTFGDQYKKK